jgi:hypothetical protein
MAKQEAAGPKDDRHDEAVNLAKEAVEEIKSGNTDERKFVLQEADRLDPKAVDEVLRRDKDAERVRKSKS